MTDQISYRVGRHQPQNVYRQGPGEPPDGSYIGVMFSPDDARRVVDALNSDLELGEYVVANQKLAKKLALAEDERDLLAAKLKLAEEILRKYNYGTEYNTRYDETGGASSALYDIAVALGLEKP